MIVQSASLSEHPSVRILQRRRRASAPLNRNPVLCSKESERRKQLQGSSNLPSLSVNRSTEVERVADMAHSSLQMHHTPLEARSSVRRSKLHSSPPPAHFASDLAVSHRLSSSCSWPAPELQSRAPSARSSRLSSSQITEHSSVGNATAFAHRSARGMSARIHRMSSTFASNVPRLLSLNKLCNISFTVEQAAQTERQRSLGVSLTNRTSLLPSRPVTAAPRYSTASAILPKCNDSRVSVEKVMSDVDVDEEPISTSSSVAPALHFPPHLVTLQLVTYLLHHPQECIHALRPRLLFLSAVWSERPDGGENSCRASCVEPIEQVIRRLWNIVSRFILSDATDSIGMSSAACSEMRQLISRLLYPFLHSFRAFDQTRASDSARVQGVSDITSLRS